MEVLKTNFKYRKALIPLNLDKVFFMVLHHIAAKAATPQQIHDWHLEKGFHGFGYSEYIRKDGTVFIGRGDFIGAHTHGMNSKSYGIALEGNFDEDDDMTDAQFKALINRIKYHKNRIKNNLKVEPHNRFTDTSCPGRYFPMERILKAMKPTFKYTLENSLEILKNNKIINTPEYWRLNAVKGKSVNGEYAGILIRNTAKKLLELGSE